MHEVLSDTDRSTLSIFDTDSYSKSQSRSAVCRRLIQHTAKDMPTPDSCDNCAISTRSSERERSFFGVSIPAAKTPDWQLLPYDDRSGKCAVSSALQESPSLIENACMSGSMTDYNEEPGGPTQLTDSDFNGPVGSALEPIVTQELLQSSHRSSSLLMVPNQVDGSSMTASRDESKADDVLFDEGFEKELRPFGKDEKGRYEVERIMDHDEHNGWKRYLVKWSGWPEEDMTWEREGNLDDCLDKVREYWTAVENPDKIGHAFETRARSIPSSDRVRGDHTSLLQPMVELLDEFVKSILGFQNSLAAQLVQPEVSERATSGCTSRKRKVLHDGQDSSDQDEKESDACLDAGVRIEKGKGKGRRRTTTRKRHRRQCGRCKATGHNSRTCSNDTVSISD